MPIVATFITQPMRPASTVLSEETFDSLDTLRIMTAMPSRAALMAELIEPGLALHEDPQNAIGLLIDGMSEICGDDASTAETPSTDNAKPT